MAEFLLNIPDDALGRFPDANDALAWFDGGKVFDDFPYLRWIFYPASWDDEPKVFWQKFPTSEE